MKKPMLPLAKLVFATVAGMGCASLLMAQPSLAQLSDVDPYAGGDVNQNNGDPFNRGNGSGFSMFDLIHQANFGTFNWNADEQNQQLDEATRKFREQQQRAFQNNGKLGTTPQNLPIIRLPENTPVQQTLPPQN